MLEKEYKEDPVKLVLYNKEWAKWFINEKSKLKDCFKKAIIEHFGSTAIPDLPAKPVIDIIVGLDDINDIDYAGIKSIGYEYKQAFEDLSPERRFFVKYTDQKISHQLHIVETNTCYWWQKLIFRDYLLAHPQAATEYFHLKEELAAKYPYKRSVYAGEKTDYIQTVIKKARVEMPFWQIPKNR